MMQHFPISEAMTRNNIFDLISVMKSDDATYGHIQTYLISKSMTIQQRAFIFNHLTGVFLRHCSVAPVRKHLGHVSRRQHFYYILHVPHTSDYCGCSHMTRHLLSQTLIVVSHTLANSSSLPAWEMLLFICCYYYLFNITRQNTSNILTPLPSPLRLFLLHWGSSALRMLDHLQNRSFFFRIGKSCFIK